MTKAPAGISTPSMRSLDPADRVINHAGGYRRKVSSTTAREYVKWGKSL